MPVYRVPNRPPAALAAKVNDLERRGERVVQIIRETADYVLLTEKPPVRPATSEFVERLA